MVSSAVLVAALWLTPRVGSTGHQGEAIVDLEKVISVRPSDASAHNALGVALAKDNMFTQAGTELRTVQRLEPGNAKYDKNLACIESHLQGCALSL